MDRPLLAAETARVRDAATRDGSFTLLLRGAGPRVPLPVLVQSLLPLSRQDGVDLVVVPMASRPDDPGLQQRIDEQVARNYGLRLEEVCEPESAWGEVLRALDSDEGAADGPVDAEVWEILRWWRPERPARGLTVFFTGLSGSGKSTVARGLLDRLHETARTVTSVDGDVARRMLSAGLTFSRADRDLNIRRIGWVASEVTRHGGVAVCAPIAPFAATRADVRAMVEANGDFVLVHISTPLAECERRDRKGLYAKARRGEIPDFTGISSPYEEPTDAEITIDTTDISVDEAVERVLAYLVDGGWIAAD